MGTIAEESKAYVPPTTANITDLELVDINWDLKEETFTVKKLDKETGIEKEEEITIQVVEVGGVKYRLPTTVKKQLKAQLKANPNLKYFKVTKEGIGLGTEYTVIPLIEKPNNNKNTVVEETIKD